MEELIKSVVCAECEEYGRASAKFGAVNNSDHESYAVLREEADEAVDAMEDVDNLTDAFFETMSGFTTTGSSSTEPKRRPLSPFSRPLWLVRRLKPFRGERASDENVHWY